MAINKPIMAEVGLNGPVFKGMTERRKTVQLELKGKSNAVVLYPSAPLLRQSEK